MFCEKKLYYCHSPVEFLNAVNRERGREGIEQVTLVVGDTGQGFLKISVSQIPMEELENNGLTQIPGPGLVHLETKHNIVTKSRKRRIWKDGVLGGDQFKDWGVRKLLILAIVRKVPESSYNLETIFQAIKLNKLRFKLTGDFSFFMPCLGLLKGCGSCNPCPLCDQERSKEGGGKARWIEKNDVNLRSFGSLLQNYTGWVIEGMKSSAANTKKWKSVTGEVLVQGEVDTNDTLVIDKIIPGPLHLYLSVNELINFCKIHCWPDIKDVLRDKLGVQFHVYMGTVGNYEGPSIRKIFRKLDSIKKHMEISSRKLFYDALVAFRQVSQSVFNIKLHPNWREHLHILRDTIYTLNTTQGMPITPKFHVLIVHVEQWIDRNGRSLGQEGESSGEALHHTWKRMLESQGESKEKKGGTRQKQHHEYSAEV